MEFRKLKAENKKDPNGAVALEEIAKFLDPHYSKGGDVVWLVKNYVKNLQEKLELEHQNFLTVHRGNMRAVNRIAELREALSTIKARSEVDTSTLAEQVVYLANKALKS